MTELKFGWLSPVIGNRWSDYQPIVMYQQDHILPEALPHFDSLWIADHFYGFDARTDPFMEAWTVLAWLAARFDDVALCHHVLGCGYRPPALTAKMAATLHVLCGGRFVLGIGAGWRQDEYEAYGYDFPKPSVRFAQLEETIEICRRMWTEDHPSFEGRFFRIDGAAAPPKPEVPPRICIGRRRRTDRAAPRGTPGRHVELHGRRRRPRRPVTQARHRASLGGEGGPGPRQDRDIAHCGAAPSRYRH